MTALIIVMVVIAASISGLAINQKSYALYLLAGWMCFLTALCCGAVPTPYGEAIVFLTLAGTANLWQAYRYGRSS